MNAPRPARAFTLLELLVAVAIMAIALVGVMQVVSQGLNQEKEIQDRSTAMELAEQKLAELLLNSQMVTGTDQGECGDLYPHFSWSSEIANTDLDGLLRLHVTVTWPSGANQHQVELESCYATNTTVDPASDTGSTTGATGGAGSPSSSSSSP